VHIFKVFIVQPSPNKRPLDQTLFVLMAKGAPENCNFSTKFKQNFLIVYTEQALNTLKTISYE